MSSISSKEYKLITPEQTGNMTNILEPTIKNAILLTLLEKKHITHWQYEQCCTKLYLPTANNITILQQ